jgi:putative nucleotidyltransferase with HDIG domain
MSLCTKKVDTEKLQPGAIISNDIYLVNGALVLEAGTVLSDEQLARLRRMSSKLVTMDFNKLYARTFDASKNMIMKAGNNERIPESDINKIVEPFLEEVKRKSNVSSLLLKLKAVDNYTLDHTVQVGILSIVLGKWLGYDKQEMMWVAMAGILHDIGKSKIPPEIINKPGRLTEDEYRIIKEHPYLGYEMLDKSGGYSEEVKIGVLQHHERENGSGYPQGLHAEQIHPIAKVVALVDVYHAMTSRRVYKEKKNPYAVLDHLRKNIGVLNTRLVLIFIDNMLQYLEGCRVILNTRQAGRVIYIDKNNLAYPLVKLENSSTVVNLNEQRHISIVDVVEN